jgi:hypothetical protein
VNYWDVKLFFIHPDETETTLQIPKNEHDHVLDALRLVAGCEGVSVQPDPFWMIYFTKTLKQFEDSMKKWRDRKRTAQWKMGKIDRAVLKQLLGDKYIDIVKMRVSLSLPPPTTALKKPCTFFALANMLPELHQQMR